MVVMGHVTASFGVMGWIKIRAYTETVDGLLDYPVWWLGKNEQWRECRVEDSALHGKEIVAKLAGCDDRDAALKLRGSQIAVPRSMLPDAAENEYYWADLVGLEVVNAEGVSFGRVHELLETGANDVMVVRGESERLIPFISQVVLEVNRQQGLIRVNWGEDY